MQREQEKQNKLLEKQIEATKARQQSGGSRVDSADAEKQLADLKGQIEQLTKLLAENYLKKKEIRMAAKKAARASKKVTNGIKVEIS